MKVRLFIGTAKGAFLATSDGRRQNWEIEGPIFKGWSVTAAERAGDGTYWVGTTSFVYGTALQRSKDLTRWVQAERSPSYPPDSGRTINAIWALRAAGEMLYAGVDEAGLFRSRDGGERWEPIEGLNEHPTRAAWMPGAGGLCAHAILVDPQQPDRVWCGISAVGVFRTDDGGATWHPKNNGVPVILEDKRHKSIGFCVHALAAEPGNADQIYRQDHCGMFRTVDGGDSWERIEEGLPSKFGFPVVVDPRSGALYCSPLESDEYRMPPGGRLQIFRSSDRGASWVDASRGLPQAHYHAGLLRSALATDGLEPGGVYAGTTGGDVFYSANSGEDWQALPVRLPRIQCVEVFVE